MGLSLPISPAALWHSNPVSFPRFLFRSDHRHRPLAVAGCGTIPPRHPPLRRPVRRREPARPPSRSDGLQPEPESAGHDQLRLHPGHRRPPPNPSTCRRSAPCRPPAPSPYALKFGNGTVKITMDRSKAPCTVNSFVSLAKQGFYYSTHCHRLGDSGAFFLQCGDPEASGMGGPGYQFADELDRHRGLQPRRRGDGQQRPEHQRLAVLHGLGCLHPFPRRTTRYSGRWTRPAPT